jgi:hypothetical protein
MESGGWEVFLWYSLGAISYMFVSRIMRYVNLASLYDSALTASLNIIFIADKEVKFMNEYRYNSLKDAGITSEEIQNLEEANNRAIDLWRFLVIQSLITMTPISLRSNLKFKTWDQAVKLIEKNRK